MRPAVTYGLITGAAVWFVGWITGMGGSFVPNLIFSVLIGFFAGGCYLGAVWLGGRSNNGD